MGKYMRRRDLNSGLRAVDISRRGRQRFDIGGIHTAAEWGAEGLHHHLNVGEAREI